MHLILGAKSSLKSVKPFENLFISPVFPQLSFFHLRMDDKPAMLLHLLRNVAKPQEQTVVFVATKHHVEYLKEVRYRHQKYSRVLLCVYISSHLPLLVTQRDFSIYLVQFIKHHLYVFCSFVLMSSC